MLKNTIIKIIVVIILAIVFLVKYISNSNITNQYDDFKEIEYKVVNFDNVNDVVDFDFEHSAIDKSANLNADRFSDCYYALFVDETDKEFLASKNIYKKMYPASMTKLMTAIIVCEKIESNEISLDDIVEINNPYDLTADGVLPSDLHYGYKISVKDLLYGLLIESNNYYALYLADYVAGSEDAFCELMNKKALELGATGTHFMNPHGLDHSEHYSTAYDIYLIIKEAYKHDLIKKIDEYSNYSYSYTAGDGLVIDADIEATNYFMNGRADLPANYNIVVWKTGTTDGAGNCLAMYLEKNDKVYIAVASSGDSKNELYNSMIKLLCMSK